MPTDEPRRPSALAEVLVTALIAHCASGDYGRSAASDDLYAYLADLEAARDFYADPAHYQDGATVHQDRLGEIIVTCSILADGGARARAVPR